MGVVELGINWMEAYDRHVIGENEEGLSTVNSPQRKKPAKAVVIAAAK